MGPSFFGSQGRSIVNDYGRVVAGPAHHVQTCEARSTNTTELVMPVRQVQDPVVFIVDDNAHVRSGLSALMESVGIKCETFKSANDFLLRKHADEVSCLILDIRLPGTGGLDFQDQLAKANIEIPIIFITGHGDISMSVKAMKAGAVEFLTKPLREQDVLDAVHVALERASQQRGRHDALTELRARFEALTDREREVMALVVTGLSNKQISSELAISEVTVKVHRHNLMVKLGVRSVAQLVRIADAVQSDRKINRSL
jgi:FixJ family two-component response regulator